MQLPTPVYRSVHQFNNKQYPFNAVAVNYILRGYRIFFWWPSRHGRQGGLLQGQPSPGRVRHHGQGALRLLIGEYPLGDGAALERRLVSGGSGADAPPPPCLFLRPMRLTFKVSVSFAHSACTSIVVGQGETTNFPSTRRFPTHFFLVLTECLHRGPQGHSKTL